MSDNFKLYSEMEKYEIINIFDGEKYNYLYNNDIIIDENGKFKSLILTFNKSRFIFFGEDEFIEVPWECVKKIGAKTIIIDADEKELKRSKL